MSVLDVALLVFAVIMFKVVVRKGFADRHFFWMTNTCRRKSLGRDIFKDLIRLTQLFTKFNNSVESFDGKIYSEVHRS